MKNINNGFLIWFMAISIMVFAVGIGLRGWRVGEDGAGGLADDRVVTSTAGTYAITIPSNWYVEKMGDGNATSDGNGVSASELAVYPDYDPAQASSSPASCKIEISSFDAPIGINLDMWITKYIHTDPTASVMEISRAPIAVGEAIAVGVEHAPVSGIEWRGILNNVTTTLVYVEASAGGVAGTDRKNIFEIAPSTLSEASDADNDDCDLDLQALVANFNIESHEP